MKHIFRKGIAILLTLTMAISMCLISVQAVENNTVYFKPASNWYQDGARFAIYFFNDKGSAPGWASMTLVEDGVYSAQLPSHTYTSVIFCRMNPANTSNNWNNRWNQSSDLVIPTDGKNCYTLSEGSWDYGSGSWSVYKYDPPVIQPDTYKVVVGDANTDNVIDVKDVTKIQRDIAFESNLSEKQTVADDITGDKAVDVKDVTALTRYLCDYDEDYGKTGFYYGETPVKGNLLKNGKFEVNGKTAKDLPFGWLNRTANPIDFNVIKSDRQTDSLCFKMNNKEDKYSIAITQLYALEPGAMYKLTGFIKTENVTGGVTENGAYLGVYYSYVVDSSKTNWRKGTTAWGEETVYFIAPTNGYAQIACIMENAGVAYFDSIKVTKCSDYDNDQDALKMRLKGEYIDTYLHKEVVSQFTEEERQIWVNDMDFAYKSLYDLVGMAPYDGEKLIISAADDPYVNNVIAHSGNPIKLNPKYELYDFENSVKKGISSFGLFHEIGHDFDYVIDWSFDLEVTTNYKMLYILDNLNKPVLLGPNPTDAKELREYYKTTYYDKSVGARNGQYDLFAMIYIFSRFTDEVGWDAVKATFREFGESMPKLTTSLGKLTYYMYRLQENYNKLNPDASGTEIRDSFPAGELEYVKQLVTTVKDGGKYVASEDYFK